MLVPPMEVMTPQRLAIAILATASMLSACGSTDEPSTSAAPPDADTSAGSGGQATVSSGAAGFGGTSQPGAGGSATNGPDATGGRLDAAASTGQPDAQLSGEFGWSQVPNTKLQSVCPPTRADYDFSRCGAVISAWSGGSADNDGNRLIVWGGGHNDYWGNEIYALNLDGLTLQRLNDPSPINPTPDKCVPELPDHTPNSKHTYGGLSYIAHARRMYVYGGGGACKPGGFSTDTWTLDLAAMTWKRMDPTVGGEPQGGLGASDYDPVSKRVFLSNQSELWDYDFDTNTYRRLSTNASTDYHMTGVVDPGRSLFLVMGNKGSQGGGVLAFHIGPGSTYAMENWTADVMDCDGLIGKGYPGLAYDPTRKLIVGWAGGDSAFLFNPDTKSCKQAAYTGGPGAQQMNGTNGRWRYLPKKDVFVLVNDWAENAYTFRLPPP
jgi:Galactose oxidase, central domain